MADAGRILLIPKGEYQPDTLYRKMDVIFYRKSSYVCKEDCIGVSPEDQEKWQTLAEGAGSEAKDVLFSDKYELGADNVQAALEAVIEKAESAFLSASNGKKAIAAAVAGKGQSASEGETFSSLAGKIQKISEDATAREADTLSGKTFYSGGIKRAGSMPIKSATSYTPSGANQIIAAGQYLSGAQTILSVPAETKTVTAGTGAITVQAASGKYLTSVSINPTPSQEKSCIPQKTGQTISPDSGKFLSKVTVNGDHNLISENIRYGISIFGVAGKIGGMERKEITKLQYARELVSAVSDGENALIVGGYENGFIKSAVVDAYNQNLTRSNPTDLSVRRTKPAAASEGGYLLFAGAEDAYGGGTESDAVDAYNQALIRSTPAALSPARTGMAAAGNGGNLLFAGGYASGRKNTVDAYNQTLVKSTPTGLSEARNELTGVKAGGCVLFAGGFNNNGSVSAVVDAYNQTLVRSTIGSLSEARKSPAAGRTKKYALIAGGNLNPAASNTVDAYNQALIRSTPTALSAALKKPVAVSNEGYVLFAGSETTLLQKYDDNLVRSTPGELSVKKENFTGVSIAGCALFAGGRTSSGVSATVESFSTVK